MSQIPKPTCCAAIQKYPAIVAGDDGSSENTDECGARWYVRIAMPSSRGTLLGYEEWEEYPFRAPEPTHCPFCGTALPKLVLKDDPPRTERVTDGGYYCDTCKGRCTWECRCLPVVARFRVEETP